MAGNSIFHKWDVPHLGHDFGTGHHRAHRPTDQPQSMVPTIPNFSSITSITPQHHLLKHLAPIIACHTDLSTSTLRWLQDPAVNDSCFGSHSLIQIASEVLHVSIHHQDTHHGHLICQKFGDGSSHHQSITDCCKRR